MADQDFNIKVITTADTSGIRQTSDALKNLQQQQKDFLQGGPAQTGVEKFIASRKAAAAASAQAADAESEVPAGITGTSVGLGTLTYVLIRAVRAWKEFNDEQDRMVDNMIKSEEKVRDLGEAILDMQDKARNAARVGTEPLEQSFIRLQQEIIRLKTEQSLLNLPEQGEEWKKLNADINTDATLLRGVTSELQRQQKQAEKTAEANREAADSFMKNALASSSPQVQAAIKNEEAARQARESGNEKDADLFQKSAEQLKASMSQAQRDEYEGLTKPTRLGRQAGPGESQSAIDDIARNKINFDRQLKGGSPLPGNAGDNQKLIDAITDLKREMIGIWR